MLTAMNAEATNHANDRDATLPRRRWLNHTPPSWVRDGTYFITLCCRERGRNELCQPETAGSLLETIRHYHEQRRWHVHLWLLMPDHAHALITCPSRENFAKVMTAWKRYTALHCSLEWQKGFFDHRLRSNESFEEKAAYILMNPVRKGLVTNPDDWPHVWMPDGRDAG